MLISTGGGVECSSPGLALVGGVVDEEEGVVLLDGSDREALVQPEREMVLSGQRLLTNGLSLHF